MLKFSYAARSVFLVLLLVVAFIAGLFTDRKIFQNQIKDQTTRDLPTVTDDSPQKTQKNRCQLYGYGDKEQYLDSYTVKRGDTLIAISKKQLGDSSRFNEIVTLNKNKYPTLSLENSFIDIGWKFLLPPQRYLTNGLILIVHGNLYYDESRLWRISLNRSSVGPFGDNVGAIQPDDIQKFSNLGLSNGDCVTVIYQDTDYETHHEIKVLEVLRQ